MKNLIAAIAITLALAVSAFAQNESQHCYVRDGYHICEFQPSGRVNVSWGDADDYHSLWYTAKTWPAAHAHLKKIWERDDAEVQAFACSQKRIAPDLDTGEAGKNCPPYSGKDTMEECLKNYKKQPWGNTGAENNAQVQCTEELRSAEQWDAMAKMKAETHARCLKLAADNPKLTIPCN
jgi:hypothetical protein